RRREGAIARRRSGRLQRARDRARRVRARVAGSSARPVRRAGLEQSGEHPGNRRWDAACRCSRRRDRFRRPALDRRSRLVPLEGEEYALRRDDAAAPADRDHRRRQDRLRVGARVKPAALLLADGSRYDGHGLEHEGLALGEAVFYTGMTGYEEALTDPSYAGQILTFTFPMIGNYGISGEA